MTIIITPPPEAPPIITYMLSFFSLPDISVSISLIVVVKEGIELLCDVARFNKE